MGSRTFSQMPKSRPSRRAIYRDVKKQLRRALWRTWTGTSSALNRALQRLLRGRSRRELLDLARRPVIAALLLAGATVASPAVRADTVELSEVAAGSGGFAIHGAAWRDWSGWSVSDAGDVNGDGLADVIIGAPGADSYWSASGTSYVVFGKADGTAVELSDVELGTRGFAIHGVDGYDRSGWSVSGAGDVNGDGLADVIVGAFGANPNGYFQSGTSYVVFGKADGTAVELSDVELGNGGFAIHGAEETDQSGKSVSGAGDVNGDGLADLIVGAWNADSGGGISGSSYVVFGKADGTAVELSDIELGTGGFAIHGAATNDKSGWSVSDAGDVNGDGLADLIVAALYTYYGGSSYVVFGKPDGTAVQLSDVAAGTGGFAIHGAEAAQRPGRIVSGAGDVNGDGLADLIVGADRADQNGIQSGSSYVVFGKADGTAVEVADIAEGIGGFAIHGEAAFDRSGRSVSGAGDVNGDGLADLIVGAYFANPNGTTSGTSYVVFGKPDGTAVALSDIALGIGGFAMHGEAQSDQSGASVSGAGDVNGDGLADLIVGAWRAAPNGSESGSSYVVFSNEIPELDSTYLAYSRPGDGPGGGIVPETVFEDGRMKVDFNDEDFGDDGFGGASLEAAVLYRSQTFVGNLVSAGLTTIAADVAWQFLTDRVNWTDAQITLKYTDAELGAITNAEEQLTVFTAAALEGPWSEAAAAMNLDTNEIAVTVGPSPNPRYFAIGLGMDLLWVNFVHDGTELGSRELPFNTLQEAVDAVSAGGTIRIDGASSVKTTSAAPTLNKSMRIEAVDGKVTIGMP